MFYVALILSILLIPSLADAWGPLTHLYLGYQLIDVGAALLPAGIYAILKKYRNDFLYGNLSADIIFGKRFQVFQSSSKTDRQKAFAYGYLTHLCADTVVHNLKPNGVPFSHSLLEIKSDSMVDKKYRRMLRRLDKAMQKKNDVFLEKRVESIFFSFKTNRRIFKGYLMLSRLPNYSPLSNFIDHRFPYEITVGDIYNFQKESLNRMFELLNNGEDSDVLKKHPLGVFQKKAS
jgi:hypothetical protein